MTASVKKTTVVEISTLPSMMTRKKLASKSQKTRERIEEVKDNLKSYHESIERLHAFAEGRITLKGKGYSELAESYKQTQEDIQRLPWTLSNLKLQIALAEHELKILLEYGA